MVNTTAEPTGEAKAAGNASGAERPPRARRPRAGADEKNGARYFLAADKGKGGGPPALDREMGSEGEALVEALRLGVTYFAVREYRVVPDFAANLPQLRREAVKSK